MSGRAVCWVLAGAALCAASPAGFEGEFGTSREGRPLRSVSFGDGEDRVLLLASIHGSEPAGTPLLERLIEELEAAPERWEGKRVVVVPVVNPDGYEAGTRGNARGIDLNRNFPADNFRGNRRDGPRPLSEPESLALRDLIEFERPARIVSIHQPLACVDFDGPGEALAEAIAARCDLSVRRLGGRPGSLGSWAGETLGIPIVTLELRRGEERLEAEALWERYGDALWAVVEGE